MAESSPHGGDPLGAIGFAGFWQIGLDGTVGAMNRAAGEIGAGVGSAWRDGWPTESRAAVDDALAAARRGETATFQAQVRRNTGDRLLLEVAVTPMYGANGEPDGFSASARPATAELEAAAFLADIGP